MKVLKFHSFKLISLIALMFFLTAGTSLIAPIDAKKNAIWHNDQGMDYLEKGYYYGAIQEFKIAILLNDDSPSTGVFYNNLGETYLKVGKYDWATDCFEYSIRYNPNFIYYYENYAFALLKSGKINSKIQYYKKLTTKDPRKSSNWMMLGILYREKKQKTEAIYCFEKFIKLEPKMIVTETIKQMSNELKSIK